MKKFFEDCTLAVIFTTICAAIAAVMGLVEAHDKKRGKRRPLPPTKILIYTAEWIRRIIKEAVAAPFRRRYDHLVRFDDSTCRLSPEMVAALEKAPVYTMSELEDICNSSPISSELDQILI